MGHVRLGRLERSRLWKVLCNALDNEPEDIPGIAAAVLNASAERLDRAGRDRAVGDAFWLLTRLATAATGPDFSEELATLGLSAQTDAPVLAFLAQLGDNVRRDARDNLESGHFRDIASLALRRSLLDNLATQGPELFGSTVNQLQEGLRRSAGTEQFGRVARQFFGDFLARTIAAAVDRELSNHVGADGAFENAGQSREFSDALDRYARESGALVQRFAADWYAKRHWQLKQEITRRDVAGFVSHALVKLRSDLMVVATVA